MPVPLRKIPKKSFGDTKPIGVKSFRICRCTYGKMTRSVKSYVNCSDVFPYQHGEVPQQRLVLRGSLQLMFQTISRSMPKS